MKLRCRELGEGFAADSEKTFMGLDDVDSVNILSTRRPDGVRARRETRALPSPGKLYEAI